MVSASKRSKPSKRSQHSKRLIAKAKRLSSNERIYRVVIDALSKLSPGELLDAPAGPGLLSHEAHQLGYQPLAADIDGSLFILPWVKYRKLDLNRPLPLRQGAFDYVVCIEGIEHVEDQYLLAREFARVLRRGGRLLITTPNISNLTSRLYCLLTGFDSAAPRPLDPTKAVPYMDHINTVPVPRLEYLLERAGLRVEQVRASHLRKGSLLLLPFFYPFLLLTGAWALLRGGRGGGKKRNRRAFRRMLSVPVLCGGVVVIQAIKK